jgi:hypothetical protein
MPDYGFASCGMYVLINILIVRLPPGWECGTENNWEFGQKLLLRCYL